MNKAILVDLEKLREFDFNTLECSYPNHTKDSSGVKTLARELSFLQICRKCELAPCIDSCPYDALERLDDGIIRRHNYACRSCKSCVAACPFGVIAFEFVEYLDTPCDLCLDRLESEEVPACVSSGSQEIIQFGDFKEDKENAELA